MTFSPRAVEAAARALCVQSGDDPDKLTYAHAMKCTGHDREPKNTWQYWMPFAEAALTAALAVDELALQGWQPIENAPKDGTWVLGWSESDKSPYRISWGRNHRNILTWCTSFASFHDGYITHWMPLLKPPASPIGKEGR